MYHHETVEEVRTEHTSSGPGPAPTKMSINNNLSELDTLIQDLNTARYTGVFNGKLTLYQILFVIICYNLF